MAPVKRRVLRLVTLLSLLACGGACALWVRSHRAHEALGHWYRKTDTRQVGGYAEETRLVLRYWGVESAGGMVGVGRYTWDQGKRSPALFAREWEPGADEDRVALRRVAAASRLSEIPLHAQGVDARGALGFWRVYGSSARGVFRWEIDGWVVPWWSVVLSTALLPVAQALRGAKRVRRRRSGRCAACGYDLRATPGRCPECGAEAVVRDARASS